MDARLEAIRNHPIVGRGSCSSVDECWSDEAIIKELDVPFWEFRNGDGMFDDYEPYLTVDDAVEWALMQHGIFADRESDIMGEADY